MSVTVSSPQEICNSPSNLSKSKMLYSFPRAHRMDLVNKNTCSQAFYDLPPVKSMRSASFGYGHKSDFTKGIANTPAPNAYSVKAEAGNEDKKGFSFGLSREQMAITGGATVGDKKSPGPGAYDVRETNKTSIAFSFRPRTNSTENQTTVKIVPGPGTYLPLETISPKGKIFVAKYKSAATTVFAPPRSKRFDNRKEGEKPGPGAYNLIGELNNSGSYFVSKFKSSVGKTFGLSLKRQASTDNLRSNVPGPGSYKLPSEFGHYEAKSASKLTSANV